MGAHFQLSKMFIQVSFKLAQLHNKIGGNSSFGSANPVFLSNVFAAIIHYFSCRLILRVSEYLSSNVRRKTFKSVDQKSSFCFPHISRGGGTKPVR